MVSVGEFIFAELQEGVPCAHDVIYVYIASRPDIQFPGHQILGDAALEGCRSLASLLSQLDPMNGRSDGEGAEKDSS